jgi:hypothetical protein
MVVGFASVKTACYYSVVYGLSNSGRHADTLKALSAAPTAALLPDGGIAYRRWPVYSPDVRTAAMFYAPKTRQKSSLSLSWYVARERQILDLCSIDRIEALLSSMSLLSITNGRLKLLCAAHCWPLASKILPPSIQSDTPSTYACNCLVKYFRGREIKMF